MLSGMGAAAPANEDITGIWVKRIVGDRPAGNQDPLAGQISFREAFGLPSDNAHVNSVNENYEPDPTWGVSLTPEELALVNKREEVRGNLHTIKEYGDTNAADSYAGLYVDKSGLVHVAFAKDAGNHFASLKGQFKHPELLRLFPASYTEQQLNDTVASISIDTEYLRKQGISVYTVATDIPGNKVEVTVETADTQTVGFLTSKYGNQLVVKAGNPPRAEDRRTDPAPWKGGIYIYGSMYACSAGFVGVGGGPSYYMITAGHCFTQGENVYHNYQTVGSVVARSWGGTVNSDSEVISIDPAKRSNLIYENDVPTYRVMSAQQPLDTDYVGQPVCKSGITTYFTCGTIYSTNTTINYQEATVQHARLATYTADQGDSGSPVFSGNTAFGIHSGRVLYADGTSHAIYTHIGYATQAFGVYVNTLNSTFAATESWSDAYYSNRGEPVAFSDVTGDGRADAIVVNSDRIAVKRSTGTGFGPGIEVWSGAYYSNRGEPVSFADVNADGKADAIVVNSYGIYVKASSGSGFGTAYQWSDPYYSNLSWEKVQFADVTGDGKADAIVTNSYGTYVKPANSYGFGPLAQWSGPFYSNRGEPVKFADVTGDGKADAIVTNSYGTYVKPSNGYSFGPLAQWSDPFYSNRGEPVSFRDVTGDGKADAIVVNNERIAVKRSTGTGFGPGIEIWSDPYYSNRGEPVSFSDVHADGRADAIVVNWAGVYVKRSS